MSVRRFLDSFADAWRGVVYTFRHEQNFRIQIVCGIAVIALMYILGLRKHEQLVIYLLVLLILVLELVNTIIEKFLDLLKPRLHGQVAVIKDVMAAAVFIAAVGSVIIGGIIFVPYIVELLP